MLVKQLMDNTEVWTQLLLGVAPGLGTEVAYKQV